MQHNQLLLLRSHLVAAAAAMMVLAMSAASCPAAEPTKGPQREDDLQMPGIKVDRKNKTVDIEGKIILPLQADWLELLACMPKSREHESIISLAAKPSHIHGALIIIGLKPGAPLKATRVGDEWKYTPPHGPKLAVTVRYEKEGKTVEVGANEWILDQKSKKPLDDNIWLFTGSRMHKVPDGEIYVADIEGNILSLVNFGDEVLSRSTDKRGGQDGGGNAWGANSKAIPATGTKIVLRLTAVKEEEKKPEQK